MHGWYFRPKVKGETIREPIHGEFFATDAISDPGMALVREDIQNSLDAGRKGEKVMVRIYPRTNKPSVARTNDRACKRISISRPSRPPSFYLKSPI